MATLYNNVECNAGDGEVSGGEAVHYAVFNEVSVGLGFARAVAGMGVSVDVELRSESGVGLRVCKRRGLGKVRRVEAVYLWPQEKAENRVIAVVKVAGETWLGGRRSEAPRQSQVGRAV